MKELLELAKTMALCKAYDLAHCRACRGCGLPATRAATLVRSVAAKGGLEAFEYYTGDADLCDSCGLDTPVGEMVRIDSASDIPNAPAVRRLMRIAKGEP